MALLFALLLAGCGDVQGEAAGPLTLSIDGRGSSYLAVQDGSGAWQALAVASDTPQKLTLTDPEGRYGLLSLCFGAATGNLSVNVQHGTVSQTPAVSAQCPGDETPATVSISGEVEGLAEGEYGNIYLGRTSALVDSAAPRHRFELPAARYDLVASRYAGGERVPNRLVLEPGLPLTGAQALDIDFYGPFSFRPEVAQLAIDGVRTGELLSGSVQLVTRGGTAGGTAARVGEYTGGNVLSYARLPAGLQGRSGQASGRGVSLRAEVQSFSYNDRTKAGSSRSVSQRIGRAPPSPPGELASVTLPAPIARPQLVLYGNTYLRPQASWQAHPAGGGTYAQFYSQVGDRHTVSYRLSQSSAWLAGRPLSYTLPDFSALPDWQAAWNLASDKELFWDVSFTQKTPFKALFVSRSGVLTP